MEKIVKKVTSDLVESSDEKTRISGQRYFRESVSLHGVKSKEVSRIAADNFREIKNLEKAEVFSLCESLWQAKSLEETIIACDWAHRMVRRFTPDDFPIFEKWVFSYIDNWAACDTFCNHTVGDFVMRYPGFIANLKLWASEDNRWVRRASAVSLIIPARKGMFLGDIFEIASILLRDRDDMVQKGYGWMLKAASQAHEKDVFDYVMKNKAEMPRTALRYAIEKMPATLKAEAMKR